MSVLGENTTAAAPCQPTRWPTFLFVILGPSQQNKNSFCMFLYQKLVKLVKLGRCDLCKEPQLQDDTSPKSMPLT